VFPSSVRIDAVSATSAERLLILLDALVYEAANAERGHDLSYFMLIIALYAFKYKYNSIRTKMRKLN
jgi:hypothetical protein